MENKCNHEFSNWEEKEYFNCEEIKKLKINNPVDVKDTGYIVFSYHKWVRACLNCGYKENTYIKPLVKIKKI